MKKRVEVYYSGRVQGVGFRYTAEAVALESHITGWVKNLDDGRVQIVCEGDEKKLLEYLDDIKNGPMKRFIADTQIEWLPFKDEFSDFSVKFW